MNRYRPGARLVFTKLAGVSGLLIGIVLLLFLAPSASAFEQVETFAETGEGAQFWEEAKGAAVNITGAGGVPPGTVYVASNTLNRLLRYGPRGEFEAAWGWKVSEGGKLEYERCGPAGEVAHPHCDPSSWSPPLGSPPLGSPPGEGAGQFAGPVGVAVDQANGDVFVVNGGAGNAREHGLVEVFSADGSQRITSFGDMGAFGETFAEGPAKIHRTSGIAVTESGTVYLTDHTGVGAAEEERVMTFKPQAPADFEHYVYAGRADDISVLGRQIALDSDGNLYVSNESKIFEFFAGHTSAPGCEYRVQGEGLRSMTVDPQSGEVFYFKYKTRDGHQLSPCDAEGKFHEVGRFEVLPRTEEVWALAFNPTYDWDPGSRLPGVLYAIESLGAGSSSANGLGYIYAPPEAIPPAVESESVSAVTASSAVAHAQINPKGSSTRYVFQYIPTSLYEANPPAERFAGAAQVPAGGGGVIAPGQNGVSVATSLLGLQPDTEYHFRAVATSHCAPAEPELICEGTGADQTFRTYPRGVGGLPDGRAYELVSPAEKHGGEVIPIRPNFASCGAECKPGVNSPPFPRQVSIDGDSIAYEGFAFSPTEGASVFNEYVARRTGSGWETANPSPALMGSNGEGYKAFADDLSLGLLYQLPPTLAPSAPIGYANLYIQPAASPSALSPLLVTPPPNRRSGFALVYAGASADLSRVFFEADDALTSATPTAPAAVDGGPTKQNLYEWSGGQLRLVNVQPGNETTAPGAEFGSGVKLISGNVNTPSKVMAHAVSTDGSRVFWSSESGQVYVRLDGETTLEIPDPGKFLSAAADGSSVLLSDGHIYDLESRSTTDLTAGKGGFEGILGQSEDLSHVYFVDTAILTGEEENHQGEKAQNGENNLYSWIAGHTSFIARLAATPGPNEPSPDDHSGGPSGIGDWQASPANRTAEASPDGDWLSFISIRPLTGFDSTGPCGQGASPASCYEVFLYNARTGALSCPSCNPSGSVPLGGSSLPVITGGEGSLPQPRYLTDAGRLYFDSEDSLAPADVNGNAEDVYQFEPVGIGSCVRAEGCVSLISTGVGSADSNFLAADASGKNVFFTTRDRLVPKDRDELVDLYDAREGGGFPGEGELSPGECRGEACQQQTPAPAIPAPTSETVVPSEGRSGCRKGQVRRNGRCVKKPRHKRHRRHKKKHHASKKRNGGNKKGRHGKGGSK